MRFSLRVRRFRRRDPRCSGRIFTKRLSSLVKPYARKPLRLKEILLLVGFTLGGEVGAHGWWSAWGDEDKSILTLLRRLHGAELPSFPLPEDIGVDDDFALLKGRRYGTIVVDLERRRPIDLLEGRSAAPLAIWLKKKHPHSFVS